MAYCGRTLLYTGLPHGFQPADMKLLLADIIPDDAILEFVLLGSVGEMYCIFSEGTVLDEVFRSTNRIQTGGNLLKVSTVSSSKEEKLVLLVNESKQTCPETVSSNFNDLLQGIANLSTAQRATLLSVLQKGESSTPTETEHGATSAHKPQPHLNTYIPSPSHDTTPKRSVHSSPSQPMSQPLYSPQHYGASAQNSQPTFSLPLTQPPVIATNGTLPRISIFSGDSTSKTDVSYQQWRYEVRGLIKDRLYAEPIIMQAIRRSLRGVAADILQHLDVNATLQQVMGKLEMIFGNVLPTEAILEKFYTARQLPSEDVSHWACRLDDLLYQLRAKDSQIANSSITDGMVRTKFYSGLKSTVIKNALRHKYDRHESYAELLLSARRVELEETDAKVNQVSVVDSVMEKKLDEILAKMQGMQDRLNKIEAKQQASSAKVSDTFQSPETMRGGVPKPAISNETNRSQAGSSGNNFGFKGKCWKCRAIGHKAEQCHLNQ